MSEDAKEAPRGAWYQSAWAMLAAGYVLPPLGVYLMWRYRWWPVWVKASLTAIGLALAAVSAYLSSAYVMPNVF